MSKKLTSLLSSLLILLTVFTGISVNTTPAYAKKSYKQASYTAKKKVYKKVIKNDTKNITVYITKTGSKYHTANCRYLSKSCIPIKLGEAKAEGYTPCSVCAPPQ